MSTSTAVSPVLRDDSAGCGTIASVQGLFERAAERYPQDNAVAAGAQRLSYFELNAQSNRLAHHLRSLGAGPGVCVGVCLDRSVNMLVGLLGVLKAGGAYVPLDPAFPRERLKRMLDNSGARLIVTLSNLLSDLPKQNAAIVCLDNDGETINACNATNPAHLTNALDLAYVIYTSGSTGEPKGVEVTHGGVVNYLTSINRILDICERDVFMAVTTLSFDICAFDLFSPLCVGGQVLLVDRATACDGPRLRERLERSDATVLQATPATWRMLIDAGWRQPTRPDASVIEATSAPHPPLKAISGGEALSRELADALLSRGVELWNLYGPTETTIYSAYHNVSPGHEMIPIGTALDNQSLYVLDDHRQPVPACVMGELYIGGAGVARGYRNRPELTAERFLPDLFSKIDSARMYRTGDLARVRSDGLVEYLGRADHQVKIRGFRVELGEIESTLLKHPGVRAAVVVSQERDSGALRLVAFVADDPAQSVAPSELRDTLRHALPEYMVPAQIVILPKLPLTFNGKIDRTALPLPPWGQIDPTAHVEPTTKIQRDLAEIFAEVLHVTGVGASDSYFDLGGDSLSAVRLSIHVEKKFDRTITLADLFRSPTVAQLSTIITDGTETAGSSLMALRETGAKPPLFCLPGSGGSSFNFRKLADQLPSERPLYGYNIPHLKQRPNQLFNVRDYADDALTQIRQVYPHGPFHLLGYSFGGVVAFEIAHILADRGESLASLGMIDCWAPGYPAKLPLISRTMLHLNAILRGPKGTRMPYLLARFNRLQRRIMKMWRAMRSVVLRQPAQVRTEWTMEEIDEAADLALLKYDYKPVHRRVDFYRVDHPPIDWSGHSFEDPYNGWRPLVIGDLHVTALPCDHLGVFEDRGTAALASAVIAQLEAGDATSESASTFSAARA